ncbi:uncharacterized protein LOC129764915 [Toxorhynchites rutilus septentrionalis]|uniref:uncharacterized protein LOC129764915 n=1 Tax=Toxorhynchites rutilus septentrionalis TaxID=329112 RepID=UPI0024789D81|nr:uncharacterized protein LOC129764915 [Toxorhynchites rutilus septentrionalis]XP_055620549.1 uncharacterized protein LOC129764915 [Toxorhynchites rutilus septentrionalis]XP_055620555.1 uncharacterized protein LOC129764915 [Toxorhynchites rutilus septentrionalis]XP_055620563.1 uncharacterized protein LOC129764915 [Toxorhynchites rutilus septentrionalis]
MADTTTSATPAPVPRPRQRTNNNSSSSPATTAEDTINNNNNSSSRDVPDCITTTTTQSLYPKLNYENVEIIQPPVKVHNADPDANANPRPIPAPRKTRIIVHEEEQEDGGGPIQYQNVTPIRLRSTAAAGAIKKPPPIPPSPSHMPKSPRSPGITTVRNDLRGSVMGGPPMGSKTPSPGIHSKRFSFDGGEKLPGLDRSESDGASVGSGDSGKKYKTSSPGELFKSIGVTSKLLTESISERVTLKTKKVANKLDKNFKNSTSSIASWGSGASSKLKTVGKSMHSMAEDKLSLSLTRKKDAKSKRSHSTGNDDDFLERRQTVPPENSELIRNIQFNSPLNNKVSNNRDDLTRGSSSSSTYDIPKNAKRTNFEEPPPYEDTLSKAKSSSNASLASASSSSTNPPPTGAFRRGSGLSQSLYSKIVPKKERNGGATPSPRPLRQKIKSESNLYESRFYIDSVREVDIASSSENIPPPSFPAPVLKSEEDSTPKQESPYGKLNIIPRPRPASSSSEEDNNLPELLKRVHIRKKPQESYENVAVGSSSAPNSRRATCNSVNRIFSRRSSSIDELRNNLNLRSDSWNFYDIGNTGEDDDGDDSSRLSTPEPTYANEGGQIYGQICEMESSLLKPEPAKPMRHDYDEVSISDIIDEFDPLAQRRRSLAAILEKGGGTVDSELALIENILGAESYGRRVKLESSDDSSTADDAATSQLSLPKPPQRSDSLLDSSTTATKDDDDPGPPSRDPPPIPRRKKSRSPKRSMIIHQNLKLPSDNASVDEAVIEPYLAVVEEPTASQEPVDFSYPSSSGSSSQVPHTSWFVTDAASAPEANKFLKNSKVDPVNEKANDSKSVEKIQKELPSELTCINEDDTYLPSYLEAVGGGDPMAVDPMPGPSASSKSSVKSKLMNALKRKSSFKAKGSDVRTVLEMVPKPLLTERLISHQGHVLKFPSGVIGDVFNELTPRMAVLKEKIIQTYQDPQKTQPKETLHLKFVLSLQCVVQHKFNNEGGLALHCFEVVLALPKKEGGSGPSQQLVTNPNLVITSTNSGNVKSLRQSYMFGVHKRLDRNVWMAKILQSVTDVFPESCLTEFTRGGWCYMKKSVSSGWSGAWLLLAKRKLYFYSSQDQQQLEQVDLRKARCIGAIESDETIRNLHVEAGPSLFIDCPPYATLYFIMASPRETQIWRKIVRDVAHKNGNTLHSQQLTKNDIPVLIDKCVNFIYAHGSMSEGIYRKSGSSTQISKILQIFKEDAFAVQLTRGEFNEYDVAGALKKFIRDIPNSFFGSYSISFVSITSLQSAKDKIDSYKELLSRLPKIEYQTLRKLIGHLSFIASLEPHNKMGIPNLAMIWGSTLMANSALNAEAEQASYSQEEADVVADLIKLYKNLYTISPEEIQKELLMLKVLQKYHAAAENLSDTVKHSGDLKVWITIDCEGEGERVDSEDRTQINVTVTPTKTASDICKELAGKTGYEWYKLTLYEVIGDGSLTRPMHYSERALEAVLRWTYWEDADRRTNYLAIRPTTTLNDVYRHIQKAPGLTPTTELKFADRRTKALRTYNLQLIGRHIVVLKRTDKKDKGTYEELMKINLTKVHAYIGREAKRDQTSLRWAITLIENDFKKRTRDSPFIGHLLGGIDFSDQILWYSSILYSLHKDDILPTSDLFF